MENVVALKYPISRYLYWYLAGKPIGPTKELVDWVMSKDGQDVVENVGYYPLPAETRAKYAGGGAKGAAPKPKR